MVIFYQIKLKFTALSLPLSNFSQAKSEKLFKKQAVPNAFSPSPKIL
jgi:hypothetical protein